MPEIRVIVESATGIEYCYECGSDLDPIAEYVVTYDGHLMWQAKNVKEKGHPVVFGATTLSEVLDSIANKTVKENF